MPDEKPPQRWDLSVHGRRHRVEVVSGSVSRTITWHVDGRLVATRRSADEHVRLKPGDGLDDESGADDEPAADPEAEPATDTGTDTGTDVDDQARADDQAGATDLGAVGVRFTTFGRPRRATWYEADGRMSASARAAIGTGGIDLDPEPGSPRRSGRSGSAGTPDVTRPSPRSGASPRSSSRCCWACSRSGSSSPSRGRTGSCRRSPGRTSTCRRSRGPTGTSRPSRGRTSTCRTSPSRRGCSGCSSTRSTSSPSSSPWSSP
ncbi:hypothetical protein [Cellulomonas sp. ATA003]|uniref:hypothetical protein n=1 Tax=Cellulomonas sp. ATA003 TaxID=3073064 RepID=UPI00287376EB|nr:hypothetical protein [Cellulomonas sp. ATA003]WNB85536.1 hypothetical protein REH70_18625 [Cellulomonas sp. ATA003]